MMPVSALLVVVQSHARIVLILLQFLLRSRFLLRAQSVGGAPQPAGGGVQRVGGCLTVVVGPERYIYPCAMSARFCGHWAGWPPTRFGSSRRTEGRPGRAGRFARSSPGRRPGGHW